MSTEVINYEGYRFIRNPFSERRSDRVYYSAWVKINGVNQKIRLHRYKWIIERGEIPKGFDIHHIDENPLNNDIANLECKDSFLHKSEHGKAAPKELRDFRANVLLTKAQPKAAEWHKSDEGKEWHKKHAQSIADSKERIEICKECKSEFTAKSTMEAKFCGSKCKSRHNMRIDRASGKWNEKRNCVICSKEFEIYKWVKKSTCSRSCSSKLKASL
jgi:hypothetical protein